MAWWNSNWGYKRSITLTNNTGGVLSNYQVLLTLTTANFDYSHCKNDGGDLRFTNVGESSKLSYWVEEWNYNGDSKIWIKVDNIPTGTNICLYNYYNNSGASDESNGTNTFEFFDDFEGGAIDTNKWDVYNNPTISGGVVTINGNDEQIFSKNYTMGKNCAFRTYSHFHNQNSDVKWMGLVDYSWTEPWLVWVQGLGSRMAHSRINAGDQEQDSYAIANMYTIFEMRVLDSDIRYLEDGVEKAAASVGWTTQEEPITFGAYAVGTIDIEWVLVRKYTSPEPTFVLGSEEEGGGIPSIIHEFQIELNLNEDIKKNSTWLLGGNFIVESKFMNNIKKNDTYIVGYDFKMEPTIQNYLKLTYGLSESFKVSSTIEASFFRANHLTSTLNFNFNLLSQFGHHYTGQIIHNCIIGGNTEYTHTISGSGEGNLLSYRVTQEWGAPYDIAQLNYKKFPTYGIGDYVEVKQLDYFTGREITVFRGVAIDLDKKYKKNFEETTVKAVSEEWYLTKQKVFWDEDWTEHISLLSTINAKRYIKYWLGGGSFSAGTEGDYWKHVSGVKPHMFPHDVPHWDTFYYNFFNFWFGTTKLDAIMQICNTCDFTFWAKYKGAFAKRYAYFYPRSMIDSGYYPFGERVTIDATDDVQGFNKRLLEIKSRESQTTFDTKTNRVAMTTQVASGEYIMARKEKPYTGESGGPKGVEVYQPVNWKKNPPSGIPELQDRCDQLYDALRKSDVAYEAKLLSLVEKSDHTTLHTGMKIRFQNVDGHPEDDFRITKIIHEKSGTDAIAITTIQYRDTDLIHLGSPKLNEIETILDNTENKIEDGSKIYGYPSSKNPRATSMGETPRVGTGEVVAVYNESETVDIKIYPTNQIVKGVPVV